MSAEKLREAARLMRERAEAAKGSPWEFSEEPGRWSSEWAIFSADAGHDFAMCESDDDAAHIASWHPAVALAVADWLDDAAHLDGQMPHRSPTFSPNAWVISWTCLACGGAVNDSALDDCSVDWRPRNPRAIAVALAYLGEQS